jgi:septum formation protein
MGHVFEVVDPGIEEDGILAASPVATSRARAEAKARAVAWARPEAVVLAADTVVALGDELLPKAGDGADIARMLRALSGRTHEVVTSVAVVAPGTAVPITASDVARVTFRDIAEGEVAAYATSGEGIGKAGGYAVQGMAAGFVASLDGDVETVVGLPTRLVRELLARARGGTPADCI